MSTTTRALNSMRSAAIGADGRRAFSAQFGGRCATCAGPISPGDKIFYAPGNENPSGLDCCGDKPDSELAVEGHADDYELPGLAVDEEDAAAAVARAMPRGRTKADMCWACFQIPANNNVCGCEPNPPTTRRPA